MRSGFEQHGRKRKEAHESADKSWKELVVQIAAVDPLKWFDRLTMSGSGDVCRGGSRSLSHKGCVFSDVGETG